MGVVSLWAMETAWWAKGLIVVMVTFGEFFEEEAGQGRSVKSSLSAD
jgi:hypothetical protein